MNHGIRVCGFITLALSMFFSSLTWADETDLVWSTFLGGSGEDWCADIAVDDSGKAYVTGSTKSYDFPTTVGAYDTTYNGGYDVFVARINLLGNALDYATYLGGSANDLSQGIGVDGAGNAYVTGFTQSSNFLTTFWQDNSSNKGGGAAFIFKLNATGSTLAYARSLGGSGSDAGWGIAVDDSGYAHVIGYTNSTDFPITNGAFDTTHNGDYDVFVAKFNPTGSLLEYCTYLGGSDWDHGSGIAVDDAGNAYVTGETQSADFPTTAEAFDTTYNGGFGDVFVAKLNPTGSSLGYATFLGGHYWEEGIGIAVDKSSNAYVTGETQSSNFPTTPGAYDETHNGGNCDVYVTKLNPSGSALDYSTFLGGNNWDEGRGIDVDGAGNAYVAGFTQSSNFPTTAGAFDTTYSGVSTDVFVAKFNTLGNTLAYATFLGGSDFEIGYGIAINDSSGVFVAGLTRSSNFPTTTGAFDTTLNGDEGFVTKLDLSGYPVPVVLVDFQATSGLSFIAIDWVTASEINCHRWEIYRCDREGGNYAKVGKLPGHGSTETVHTYQWVDHQVIFGKTYFYKLKQVDFDGSASWSHVVSATVGSVVPETYDLSQNYPNPFNANTEIRYEIPERGHVTLKVFNALGQKVRTIVDGNQEAGQYTITWGGRDEGGREVASGLYFCRLNAGGYSKTIKMMLIK